MLSDRRDGFAAREAVAEEERDAVARALDEERAVWRGCQLPEAAKGDELDVRDAEERRGEER